MKNIEICILESWGQLENVNKDCWFQCNKQQGKCIWCGTDGLCCKNGTKGSGCDGTFGGKTGHRCVIKAGKHIKKAFDIGRKICNFNFWEVTSMSGPALG